MPQHFVAPPQWEWYIVWYFFLGGIAGGVYALGAILRNTDAAELLLRNDRLDVDELSAILADVRRDGHRAGAVIARLRALLERRNVEMQTMTWSEVVGEVLEVKDGPNQLDVEMDR